MTKPKTGERRSPKPAPAPEAVAGDQTINALVISTLRAADGRELAWPGKVAVLTEAQFKAAGKAVTRASPEQLAIAVSTLDLTNEEISK